MQKQPRKKRLLHVPIQGALIGRVVTQWAILVVCIFGTCVLLQFLMDPLQDKELLWRNVKVMAISFGVVSFALLPPFLWDLLKFSHRFVGPILRLRGHIQNLKVSETPQPLTFRRNDYWSELADDFNGMMQRIRAERLMLHEQSRIPSVPADPVDADQAEMMV